MRVLVGVLALLFVPSATALSVEADPRGSVAVGSSEVEIEARLPDLGSPIEVSNLQPQVPDVSVDVGDAPLSIQTKTDADSSQPRERALIPEAAAPVAAVAGGSLLLMLLAYGLGGLEWLRQAFGWGLFSRIEDNELLKHPFRARLHDTILQNPGLPLSELCLRIGASWGTTVHHLRRMERARLVASERGRAGRLYFPANSAASNVRAAWAATSSGTARRIARFIHEHPGTDQKTVCAMLGLRNPAASKHLGRFEELGLVASRFEARHRIYTPTPNLRMLVEASSPSSPTLSR